MNFDYYYGAEAEQFSFYRVPRMLIKDERFKVLSSDAKLLYGLMLDRMSLSMKNGWFDEDDRVYIHYKIEEIMEDLGCAKEKCFKVIAEIDSKKGIGLIEKKRQGLGKPDIIYVKNFTTLESKTEPENQSESPANTDSSTEVRKPNFKNFDNQTSKVSETELTEVRESNTNYTNINYTDISYTNPINSINLSKQEDTKANKTDDKMDMMDDVSAYIELIKQNIEYEYLMNYDESLDKGLYKELFEIICEVVCVKRKTVKISGEDYPYELVKSKFLKLNSSHLQYVIDCMQNITTKIGNIKAYMITALYNAPSTMNHYYQQKVQYDMYGGYG